MTSQQSAAVLAAAMAWHTAEEHRRAAGRALREAIAAADGLNWPAPEVIAAQHAESIHAAARKAAVQQRRDLRKACDATTRPITINVKGSFVPSVTRLLASGATP